MKFIRIVILALLVSSALHISASKKNVYKHFDVVTPTDLLFDYFFDDALRERLAGHFDVSIDLLNACNSIKPDDGNVMYELSKIYVVTKQIDKSIVCLEKASVAQPENIWFKTALAEQYLASQKVDKAVEVYNAIVKIDPENDDALMMLVNIYSQSEKYNEAIAALNLLEKVQGVNQEVTMEKARLYFMQNQNKKGIAEIDKLVKANPNEPKYQVLRGDIYLDQKMQKEALVCYQQVLESDPNNGDALYSLSKYYKAIGDSVSMMATLDQMMRNKNVDLEPKISVLKDLVTRPAEMQKVEGYLASLLEMYPEEEGLHNYNYLFLLMKQKNQEAENELKIMLDLNPQNKLTWTRMIDMKIKQENFSAIDSLCTKALEYFADDVDFYFYKAIALFQLGKYRQTIISCNKALQLVPDENIVMRSQIYTQMGDTYYKLGLKDSTYLSYTQSLKYQPNNIGTLNNYAYYLSLDKRELQKAESMSAKTVAAEPTNATYLDTYAWIFFVQGKYSLAKIYEKQAIENGGDKSVEVLEHYGDILFLSGEKELALEWWQKAVKAGGDSLLLKKKIETKSYLEK
ncbi:MAG: Tetratricopeptide 1 repeat-containing protein [Bacteroidetes bacterium]|nr:Tetratricopeptide 1 repeat-containing protein [Bacteroidota bacterium]